MIDQGDTFTLTCLDEGIEWFVTYAPLTKLKLSPIDPSFCPSCGSTNITIEKERAEPIQSQG